jgi:SAM-dependent methyltransferase
MPETDPAGARREWGAVAPAWEAHRERLFENARPVSEWLVEHVDPKPGQTVVELTAGPGETGFLVAPLLGPSGRLVSSDVVPAMVDAAARGAARRGLDNVECRVLDAQQLDLPDRSVDAVLSRFGIMLLPEPHRAMAEIRRVLRQGGRLAYATWGAADRNPWIFVLGLALMQHGHPPSGDPFSAGGVFSLADPESNRALVTAAGFGDVTVEELTGTTRFENPDDYWSFSTAVAGPLAELVGSLGEDEVRDVRATLDGLLAPFERDGVLELPWSSIVTSAA